MVLENRKSRSPRIVQLLYYWTSVSLKFSVKGYKKVVVEKGGSTYIVFSPIAASSYIQCEDVKGKSKPSIDQIIFTKKMGVFLKKQNATDFYREYHNQNTLDVHGPDGVYTIGIKTPIKEVKDLINSLDIPIKTEAVGYEKAYLKKAELIEEEKENPQLQVILYQKTTGERENLPEIGGFLQTKHFPLKKEIAFPDGPPERIVEKTTFNVTDEELLKRKNATKWSWKRIFAIDWERFWDNFNKERREQKRYKSYSSFNTK